MSWPKTAETQGIAVRTVGQVARRLLGQAADGRVLAVFRSAFYVESRRGLLCIGTLALEPGPITLVSEVPAGADWRVIGIAQQAAVAVSAVALRVGARFRFRLGDAADWRPEPIRGPVVAAAAARGLAGFRAIIAGRPVAGGLGGFADPGYVPEARHREGVAAAGFVAGARGWVTAAVRSRTGMPDRPGAWAVALTGLGPGLTPSGDDFLGGMMLALHALGRESLARELFDAIRPCLGRRTNSVSAALLGAASEGFGSAGIHAALAAILRGDAAAMRSAVPALDRIGHSSGWDAMAGVAAVLGGWLDAQRADAG